MLKNNGFSLIELMIAMVIGLFALLAISMVLTNNLAFGRTTIDSLRLNQEVRTTMNIISDDIRRAGYWNNSSKLMDGSVTKNPHAYPDLPLTINESQSCILFSYDRDSAGDVANDNEKFGFALINNIIYMRTPGSAYSCVEGEITASNPPWQAITDKNTITITKFKLIPPINPTNLLHQYVVSSDVNVCIKEIKIEISARLLKNSDSTILQNVEKTIRLRNDEIRSVSMPSKVCS